MRLSFKVAALAAGFSIATLTGAMAEEFPSRDITMVVPWSAGGGTDTVARTLVKNAKECLGVGVNVVNKTGGMGAVGMGAAAAARPDGYTVGMVTFQLSAFDLMGLADLSFRNYDLLQLVNLSAGAISVRTDSQFKSLKELISYASENPGVLTVGHAGAGGAWHLSIASVAAAHGAELTYVPFNGGAKIRTSLLGGHVAVATSGIDEMLQLYQDGQVRILAVNSLKRIPAFPDVPTVAEAGFPVAAPVLDWRGLATPKGVPEERLAKLREGFKRCFDSAQFQDGMAELGLTPVYADSAGFTKFLEGMEKSLESALASVGLLKAQ